MLGRLPCAGQYGSKRPAHRFIDVSKLHQVQRLVFRLFPNRVLRRETPTSKWYFRITVSVAACAHLALLSSTSGSLTWLCLCVLAALWNGVLGGYGHNYLHAMDARSLALDWNGLSSFEWLLEHVVSHHPHPNTEWDHDSISMRPFVDWNRSSESIGHVIWLYIIFCIGEVAVAIQGYCGHRCRCAATDYKHMLPAWLVYSPWLFIVRAGMHVACHGIVWGTLTLTSACTVASFYFSWLAHLNHSPPSPSIPLTDVLDSQLQATRDIRHASYIPQLFVLGLDRQTLHHLFPSIDHSRLDDTLRRLMQEHFGHQRFECLSCQSLHTLMCSRLLSWHRAKRKKDKHIRAGSILHKYLIYWFA